LPDVEYTTFEVDIVPTEGEQFGLPEPKSDADREQRTQAMIGARGQESARLLRRPRLYLDALNRGRTHHRRDIPFDQLLSHGLAEHCARGAVDDLDRARAWSVTLPSPVNGTMVDAGQPFPSINSLSDVVTQNSDGSFDLYFAPELPEDVPEGNWIKTNPGEGFAASLRLYGATMPFYDQTWIPDDVTKIS
jgi:hypothetical protein